MSSEAVLVNRQLWKDVFSQFTERDVALVGDDGHVEANMALLRLRSPVFRQMFGSESSVEFQVKAVNMTDYNTEALSSFVSFIESGTAFITEEIVYDLLKMADHYQLPSLKKLAEDFLMDNLAKTDAARVYEYLIRYSPDRLKKHFIKGAKGKSCEVCGHGTKRSRCAISL